MKMQNQLFIVLLFLSSISLAQNDDHQWLIVNQIGKRSEASNLSIYPTTNSINASFFMSGVSLPDLANDPQARNDLFAVFEDGEHFNSRGNDYSGMNPVFFEGPFNGNDIHHFNNGHAKSISYMYLTNRYEKDDLPRKVAMENTSGTPPTSVRNIDPNIPALLSANHNVVFTRDITVVVNYELLRRQYLANYGDTKKPEVVLKFNGYESISRPGRVYPADILDPSPIFINSTGLNVPEYPIGKLRPGSTSEEYILEDGPEKYRYINLRTNANAFRFPPGDDGAPQYNAVFSLSVGGNIVATHPEAMTHSYDPNFIRVDSICRTRKNDYHVYYHLEFENTGSVPVSDYKAMFNYPAHFDFTCFEVLRWSAAGNPCSGVAKAIKGKVIFDFNCNTQLLQQNSDPKAGIAYVDFRVRIPAPYNVVDPTQKILFNTPTTNFAGMDFEIKEFKDKIVADSSKPYRPILNEPCKFCKKTKLTNWPMLTLIMIIPVIMLIVLFIFPGLLRRRVNINNFVQTR